MLDTSRKTKQENTFRTKMYIGFSKSSEYSYSDKCSGFDECRYEFFLRKEIHWFTVGYCHCKSTDAYRVNRTNGAFISGEATCGGQGELHRI